MKINIYYGGRGVINDPTKYVVKEMMSIFKELNVSVEKYDLFDQKANIATLPQTLKEVDGIILATTVEWHGVGGYIMNFLDACWLYGDKEKIRQVYMAPVVMATTYGEREAELDLKNAWEALGGRTCNGLCGYITDVSELEDNESYNKLIEHRAESIYRTINQKREMLPVSSRVVSQKVYKTRASLLTQQETEQLSEYISDETYVKQQKADIKELAGIFKGRLGTNANKSSLEAGLLEFKTHFRIITDTHVKYKISLSDLNRVVSVKIDNAELEIKQEDIAYPDLELTLSSEVLNDITSGRKTFQGGFMEGLVRTKGEFGILRLLDSLFPFLEDKEGR